MRAQEWRHSLTHFEFLKFRPNPKVSQLNCWSPEIGLSSLNLPGIPALFTISESNSLIPLWVELIVPEVKQRTFNLFCHWLFRCWILQYLFHLLLTAFVLLKRLYESTVNTWFLSREVNFAIMLRCGTAYQDNMKLANLLQKFCHLSLIRSSFPVARSSFVSFHAELHSFWSILSITLKSNGRVRMTFW